MDYIGLKVMNKKVGFLGTACDEGQVMCLSAPAPLRDNGDNTGGFTSPRLL